MTQTYKVQVSMNQAHIVESGFVWKQGDFGFELEIEVLDFDTSGVVPQIIFRKPSGAVESTSILQDGNKFKYVIRGTELDVPGPCICDLKLKHSDTQRISTASFKYFTMPDTMDGLDEQASSYSDSVAKIVNNLESKISNRVPYPISPYSKYGTSGQLLRTLGNGKTEWVDVGLPTDEQTSEAVTSWLNDHPEATTTVEDNSLTYNKLITGTLGFITPKMFGAVGDGVTDDTEAIRALLNDDALYILFEEGTYLITEEIKTEKNHRIIGNNATLLVSEDVTVTDLRLINFKNLDELYIDSLNFKIVCTNNTPYSDSPDPNTGGILLAMQSVKHATVRNSKMEVIDNGTKVQCTCCWPTGTGESYVFENCDFINSGNTMQGGCLWMYGNFKHTYANNCRFLISTKDEAFIEWGSLEENEATFESCYFKATYINDQIFSLNNQYVKLQIYNSVIEQNPDYLCYVLMKVTAATKAIINGCTLNLYSKSGGKAFHLSNGGELLLTNSNIVFNGLDSNNNPLVNLSNGIAKVDNNIIKFTGTKRTMLFVETNKDDSEFYLLNNYIEFDGTLNNYLFGYKTIIATNNVFMGNNEYQLSAATSLAQQVTRLKVTENNIYKCTFGAFWNTTGDRRPTTTTIYLGNMQAGSTKTINIGKPGSYSDIKMMIVTSVAYNRMGLFYLTYDGNNTNYKAYIGYSSDYKISAINGEEATLLLDSIYGASDVNVILVSLYPRN